MFKTLNYLLVIYTKKGSWLQASENIRLKRTLSGLWSNPHKKHSQLLSWLRLLRALSHQYLQGWRLHSLSGQCGPVLTPPPSCEKLFSLYPQCLNKISFGCSAAIQKKPLNYYIQSSCRCYTHSTILSYKSLQVNRKVRMQFAGPHWYLHSSYCDS